MKCFGVILQVYGTENLVSMMNYFFDSICFHDDLTYDWISFGGWRINLTDHFLPDIRTSTLTAFLSMNYSAFHNICEYLYVHFLIVCLDELEGWKLCEGKNCYYYDSGYSNVGWSSAAAAIYTPFYELQCY